MLRSPRFRTWLLAAIGALTLGIASPALADSGTIQLTVYKGGWIIGGSGGSGTLTFKGRRYALGIGGVSVGFTFGGSKATLSGTVNYISRPSDVAGVYGAAGAGAALGSGGAGAIVLTNEKGAVLELQGRQVGLMVNADFSGLAITLK